ncbi:hypothetical protein G6F62_007377 [Rhizopus arrhizus]|nr:hypothetical protein G6F23_008467 [Rhizopus arrhizus]KAG0769620.1 hypothetical protein G6F24_000932 [Rhizopus arrhizus]KAG0781146.1 hypothetical protein G6F22_009716 [Rhizopus arrhizus]KAG0796500.1 hypothetical protein G6F21_001275 [Rhizopus arrhizus]KAG0819052.1 hypothetical protein G6F20_001072 [Rhizopus arrhizus]
MSVDNLVPNHISFDSPNHHHASITVNSSMSNECYKNRNKQCVPSDDEEEEDEEEEVDNASDYELGYMPIRKTIPLPSDDEEEEEEEEEDDNQPLDTFVNKSAPTLVLVEGSHLQQRQQHYQYQQARLAKFHHQPSSMTGMDLLNQLEKEKAKRTLKPKKVPSQVKIKKGLLSQLPEAGSHNISFQQLQQEQMRCKGYLDPEQQRRSFYSRSRSPSPHKK